MVESLKINLLSGFGWAVSHDALSVAYDLVRELKMGHEYGYEDVIDKTVLRIDRNDIDLHVLLYADGKTS